MVVDIQRGGGWHEKEDVGDFRMGGFRSFPFHPFLCASAAALSPPPPSPAARAFQEYYSGIFWEIRDRRRAKKRIRPFCKGEKSWVSPTPPFWAEKRVHWIERLHRRKTEHLLRFPTNRVTLLRNFKNRDTHSRPSRLRSRCRCRGWARCSPWPSRGRR